MVSLSATKMGWKGGGGLLKILDSIVSPTLLYVEGGVPFLIKFIDRGALHIYKCVCSTRNLD